MVVPNGLSCSDSVRSVRSAGSEAGSAPRSSFTPRSSTRSAVSAPSQSGSVPTRRLLFKASVSRLDDRFSSADGSSPSNSLCDKSLRPRSTARVTCQWRQKAHATHRRWSPQSAARAAGSVPRSPWLRRLLRAKTCQLPFICSMSRRNAQRYERAAGAAHALEGAQGRPDHPGRRIGPRLAAQRGGGPGRAVCSGVEAAKRGADGGIIRDGTSKRWSWLSGAGRCWIGTAGNEQQQRRHWSVHQPC